MKSLPSLFLHFLRNRTGRRNLSILLRFLVALTVIVALYSVVFHFLMVREGREYSWVTGIYWTLTVMSTLGFGDITFHSDAGRLFSLLVLLTGIMFLLVLLPFTFIEFCYEPWMKAQAAARVPQAMPRNMSGHVVLTNYGPIASALIDKLTRYDYPYVVVLPDFDEALRVHDRGINVMLGDLDDPETYRKARVKEAALVATTRSDIVNTTVAFTVRELTERVRVVATARKHTAAEVLKVAGCTRVLELSELTGRALARRTRGGNVSAHVIGQLDEVLVAEANAAESPLVGKSLKESHFRDTAGVTVVGMWDRGRFEIARPETVVGPNTVLVLAGSRTQLSQFDGLCRPSPSAAAPVIIIGGGQVGQATARALTLRSIEHRVVDRKTHHDLDPDTLILGNATNPATLEKAGIKETPAVIVTTHDDDTNIYLTIFARRVRPDVQIISRATMERSVPTLHRAGSDFVISYASMGANTLFNLLKRSDILMVAEGLNVFKVKMPESLVGKSIAKTSIRSETGCSIVAIDADKDGTVINPAGDTVLAAGTEIVLIGTVEAENAFLRIFGKQ